MTVSSTYPNNWSNSTEETVTETTTFEYDEKGRVVKETKIRTVRKIPARGGQVYPYPGDPLRPYITY